jgi:cell division protein ZapE
VTPLDYYHEQCQRGQFIEDKYQRQALVELARVHKNLLNECRFRKCFPAIFRKPKAVKGAYLCGHVGIGKTTVMDSFYHSLPISNKWRIHFHQFMHEVHNQLKDCQGKKNPLQLVANRIAKNAIVVCLDELHVHDIADVVILAGLLKALNTAGVCIITTSNMIPDDLYKNGLQRISFLPAIALFKQHCTLINFETLFDYRTQNTNQQEWFFHPNDQNADNNLTNQFNLSNIECDFDSNPIMIYDRAISVIKKSTDIVWFDFKHICHPPRSPADYLALTKQFNTILISNIPKLFPSQKDKLNLFIRMIDIFYDAGIRFICSAETDIDHIYSGEYMSFEYQRTKSRLLQMVSAS